MTDLKNTSPVCLSKLETTYASPHLVAEAHLSNENTNPLSAGGTQTLIPAYRWADTTTPCHPGQNITLRHTGKFQCTLCSKSVKKLYSGYCYVCLTQKAAADRCVMNPHLCHYAQGTCREPEWGRAFCFQPHYVYLAFTDKFKVGITRQNQIPTRWFDQGATAAVLLAQTPSRHQAGVFENFLAQTVSDKSQWQNMLAMGNNHPTTQEVLDQHVVLMDLLRERLAELTMPIPASTLAPEAHSLEIFLATNPTVYFVQYPLPEEVPETRPLKWTSISLDKQPDISGVVTGIKGQYIFLGDRVFNPRRYEGYMVDLA